MPDWTKAQIYKFEILSQRRKHHLELKSDPYGFAAKCARTTASVVARYRRLQLERRRLDGSAHPARLAASRP